MVETQHTGPIRCHMALKPTTVLLLEDDCPWHALPSWLRDGATLSLATGPKSEHYLATNNLPFLVPDDLVAADEVEAACVAAYELLHGTCCKLDGLKLAPPRTFAHALTDIAKRVDAIIWRALTIEKLRARFPNSRFAAFRAPPSEPRTEEWDLGFRPHPWSGVLADVDWAAQVLWLDRPAIKDRPKRNKPSLASHLRRNPYVWSAIQSCRSGLTSNLPLIVRQDRPALLVLKAPYDWSPVLHWASEQGIPLMFDEPERYLGGKDQSTGVEAAADAILSREWGLFCESLPGYAFAPMQQLLPDLRKVVLLAPAAHRNVGQVVAAMRRKFRIAAVLNAIGPDLRMQTIMGAYQEQGVPVLKWQHGSVWCNHRINQRMDECDLATADIHFTYGEGTVAAYAASGRNLGCKLVAAGSSRLEALARQAKPRLSRTPESPCRLLYTPTNTYGDSWYCGFSPPFMDASYRRDQKALLDGIKLLLERNPDARLTIKMPSHCSPLALPEWVKPVSRSPQCRLVFQEESHSSLLLEHDVAIIDCATTTMLEALVTYIPLLVLMRAPRWPETELSLLRRRARCFDEPRVLLQELTNYLAGQPYQADVTDQDFIRRHGLGVDSTKEAKEVIEGLIRALEEPSVHLSTETSRHYL